MASTCGSTLSLMNAGVPIKRPVSGIAMGIIVDQKSNSEKFKVLTDIQGLEDHYGDMDFKAAGTSEGITACQMDIKIDGLKYEIMEMVEDKNEILHLVQNEIPLSKIDYTYSEPSRVVKFTK